MAPFFYKHKLYKVKTGLSYDKERELEQIVEAYNFRTKRMCSTIAGAHMYYKYSQKSFGGRNYAFAFVNDCKPFKAGDMIFLAQHSIEEIPDERKEKTGIVFMNLPEI